MARLCTFCFEIKLNGFRYLKQYLRHVHITIKQSQQNLRQLVIPED